MAQTRFSSLQAWLDWQETLHPRQIELGLERIARVGARLQCLRPAPVVVSVAGTNGKGSSVAMLEAILSRAGHRVACYTSPHLLRYNERVRIDGEPVSDETLCAAFARVDEARADVSLTYFEFGTLAALWIMGEAKPDVAVLEVGLGGRLDAVNIVDADVALITSIGIDHTDWLGGDRETIAREKAGIMRARRPAVCADSRPPDSLFDEAGRIGAELSVLGRDFTIGRARQGWHWQGRERGLNDLPLPGLPGAHQLANAAGVLRVLETLERHLPVERPAIDAGLKWACLAGRIQRLAGRVEQVLDVSHNAQAAEALADALRQWPLAGRTYVVLGMMADKDVAAFVAPLIGLAERWYTTGLATARACSADELAARIRPLPDAAAVVACASMDAAVDRLRETLQPGDRVLVCGSFHTVAQWSLLNPVFD